MPYPFTQRVPGGVLAKLFRTSTRTGVVMEIEALLARAGSVRDVRPRHVEEVCARHGVDFGSRLATARRGLYRRYLEHCLHDQIVSADEASDLTHLRELLRLAPEDVSRVHDEVSRSVYGEAIEQVLSDHKLDPEEKKFLESMREQLQIPEDVAEQMIDQGVERSRRRFLEKAAASENVVLGTGGAPLKLAGSSDHSVDEAIRAAVAEAAQAVPRLSWVETTHIRTEVKDGQITSWHVELKGWLDLDES